MRILLGIYSKVVPVENMEDAEEELKVAMARLVSESEFKVTRKQIGKAVEGLRVTE